MNPRLPILLLLSLLPVKAGAQDGIGSAAALQYSEDHTLWFGSENAAGLAFRPLSTFNIVGFGFGYEDGAFHRYPTGEKVSDLDFDTRGALAIGKMQLWGHFRYDNITERGTRFNTVLFDPYDERQIFSVADPNLSDWKRQVYDMEFKAALPLGDRFAAGLHLRYTDRLAAKQVDPRSESFKYSIELRPSLVWRIGKSALGISGAYSNMFERSVPVLSNTSEIQEVMLVRGLGNYVRDMVGSGGLSTIYYHCDSYGGALQYHFLGNQEMLAEVSFLHHGTSTRESATQPFNMGSVAMNEISASVQFAGYSSLLKAEFLYRDTEATEYTSVWNKSTGEWEVRTSALGSTYGTLRASLSGDRYFGHRDAMPYIWKLSGKAGWVSKTDRYMLPEASFEYSNLGFSASLQRLFGNGKVLWEASVEAGYKLNLAGAYNYTGMQKDGIPVKEWYPHDMEILSSNAAFGAAGLGMGAPLSGRMSGMKLTASCSAGCIMAGQNKNRLLLSAGVGLIF